MQSTHITSFSVQIKIVDIGDVPSLIVIGMAGGKRDNFPQASGNVGEHTPRVQPQLLMAKISNQTHDQHIDRMHDCVEAILSVFKSS